ncbi:MAG: glycoside hydrolase family 97 protein [Porphyromonadaceae bacterium]|nr:glycoside hydrolase family 97 protein [Porphyromonadaceae bacterium]
MKKINFIRLSVLLWICIFASCASKTDFTISSPDDKITAIVKYDKEQGTVHYVVQSRKQEIISSSSMGISTSLGDFTSGMKLKGSSKRTIDETYSLPQGKVSTYRNHANEQTLTLHKNGQQLNIVFRVYNDGIAYRYEIPGEGNIEFTGEISSINLADTNLTYYGQNHPNRYGYESALGPIDGEQMSNPVLAHLKDKNHFVLMGQAATYGNYVQTHFQRSGNRFTYSYPLDQEKIGPVHSTLPFQSPWRMAIISPENPGKIVESYMVENLNPPTKPVYLNQDGSIKDWIKPGRVMWDFIARDGDKPRMWIDAVKEMGWEYYMADAGFANRWGGSDSVLNVVEYADSMHVGVIGWAHTREFDTPAKADSTMKRYADWGLKGAKIDFFDNNTLSENPRDWRDYEDTQQSLQMRDWIFDLGIEYSFLLELHGNTIPTGERRQYPNLMTLEGVDGMERRTKPASNDLTIPYVRNVMGPVSYTVIHFERSPGTHAYQLAMPIVYEAGLMIYAEHGKKLLEWPGREIIKDIPSTWDETKYIEGMPAEHIVIARRNGEDWYIGGMTDKARTIDIPLNFLNNGKKYHALIFSDDTHTTMKKETKLISSNDTLSLNLLERGGFALRLRPE